MSRLDALRWKVEQWVPCEREHTLHRDEATERHWVTCGDDVIAETTFSQSSADLSGDIRYFLRATLDRHKTEALLADLRDLVAVVEAARKVGPPECEDCYEEDCTGNDEGRCPCGDVCHPEQITARMDLRAVLAHLDEVTGGEQ